MKKTACKVLVLAGVLFLSSAAMASECSGPWRQLQEYRPGTGGACAAIGLNTYQAVCQPGQRYALYCDDARGGRYRVCESNIPCERQFQGRYDRWDHRNDRRDDRWDNRWDRRNDRREYREERREDRWRYNNDPRNHQYRDRPFDCTQWDYDANRPCPAGTVNRDCRNGCAGR